MLSDHAFVHASSLGKRNRESSLEPRVWKILYGVHLGNRLLSTIRSVETNVISRLLRFELTDGDGVGDVTDGGDTRSALHWTRHLGRSAAKRATVAQIATSAPRSRTVGWRHDALPRRFRYYQMVGHFRLADYFSGCDCRRGFFDRRWKITSRMEGLNVFNPFLCVLELGRMRGNAGTWVLCYGGFGASAITKSLLAIFII